MKNPEECHFILLDVKRVIQLNIYIVSKRHQIYTLYITTNCVAWQPDMTKTIECYIRIHTNQQ